MPPGSKIILLPFTYCNVQNKLQNDDGGEQATVQETTKLIDFEAINTTKFGKNIGLEYNPDILKIIIKTFLVCIICQKKKNKT